MPAIMLMLAGIVFVFLALFYNEFLIARFDPNPPLEIGTAAKVRRVEVVYLLVGLSLLWLSRVLLRETGGHALRRTFGRDGVAKCTILVLTLVAPVLVVEACLRPIVRLRHKESSVFIKDKDLGWKLRPGTEDNWKGVRVRINAKGLRGPELEYEKAPGRTRILYLGDSVTFGFGLESYGESFPYRMEPILEDLFGEEIETVNAAVGGYSPWQERIFLEKEGIRYDPDLVVVSFVLNDVGEKSQLARFGGAGEGWQLTESYYSFFDWLRHHSASVHVVYKMLVRRRFGEDVGAGAREKEAMSVQRLVDDPRSRNFERAWEITLENLTGIFEFCRRSDIPVLLVAFPFTYQFENVELLSGPQEIVGKHAGGQQVPYLDLLPILNEKITARKGSPADFFLDDDHLSAHGSEVVAEVVAGFIRDNAAALLPHLAVQKTTR